MKGPGICLLNKLPWGPNRMAGMYEVTVPWVKPGGGHMPRRNKEKESSTRNQRSGPLSGSD